MRYGLLWGVPLGMFCGVMTVAMVLGLVCIRLASRTSSAVETAHELITRVNEASKPLLNCKGNGACLPAQILGTARSIEVAAGAVAKQMPAIAAAAGVAAGNSVEASRETAAAMVEMRGLVQEGRSAMGELDQAIRDLDEGVKTLAASGDATVRAAGETLRQLTAMEKVLTEQVTAGSAEAVRTLEAMTALVSDPAWVRIVANTEAATEHGAATVETVDIATRGLRQKAGRVKWLIERIAGLVKVTFPL